MSFDRIIALRNNKTIYRDSNRTIKEFDAKYSKSDILSEALSHAFAENAGFKVPALLEINLSSERPNIVYEYVKGQTLAELMELHPEKTDEYLATIIDLQIEIHSRKDGEQKNLVLKLHEMIDMADLPDKTKAAILRDLDKMPKMHNLCHGDLEPSNVVIAKDNTPYILDWSLATVGNHLADIARSYILLRMNYDQNKADKYLDMICQKIKIKKEDVLAWLPFVCAASIPWANKREQEYLYAVVYEAYKQGDK